MSFKFTIDTTQVVKGLEAISEKAKDAAYAGAQAAAQEFHDEAKLRVPAKTGKLRDSIYQVLSKDNSTDTKAVYHIAWNHRKAPHGHLIEFGTSRAPAQPFLRPAYEAVKQQAIEKARAAFAEKMK